MLVTELRNEDVIGVGVGERVFARLDRAQVFSLDGKEAEVASDELAVL